MTENELKQNIARNISTLRRARGMTQAELADKLSYSDKSVSKWERGDGLPDVLVLTRIAELFDVSVNDLLASVAPQPQAPAPQQRRISLSRHTLITALSVGLVWFVAALVFFFIKVILPESAWAWMTFVTAIPVAAIVLVVFMHLWWGIIPQCLSVSALVWSVAVVIHLAALRPQLQNATLIYVAAGVFQVLVVLWYAYQYVRLKWHRMQRSSKKAPDEPSPTVDASDISDNEIKD